MNDCKNFVIVGLVSGREGYGVRRAWLGILVGLRGLGRMLHMNAIVDGSLVADFRARGVDVNVLGVEREVNVSAGAGKSLALLRRAWYQISIASRLVDSVRRSQAELILFRSPLEVFMAGCVARRLGIKAFWLMPNSVTNNYPFDLNRRIYRLAFRYLNVVPIGNSLYTIRTLGDPERAHYFVHLGVDPTDFDTIEMGSVSRASMGIPADAPVLGVFARMVENKGQLRLIEALAVLGAEAGNVHLIICGGPIDTPYAQKVAVFIEKNGLSGRVHLQGPTSKPQPYYALCDVVVNSRIDPEPFGLSVIEAMVMGKPVFAHAAGGPGETILDGQTGWLINEPSTEAFVAGLKRVLADRDRWPVMSVTARQHGRVNFSSDAMAKRLLKIVEQEMGSTVPY